MSLTPYPGLDELIKRLRTLADVARRWSSVTYRSVSPRHAAPEDMLSGNGSKRSGGRWNPIGLATIYSSMSPETAMAETLAHVRYYRLPVHRGLPRLFVPLRFKLSKVLDLTDGTVRKRLRLGEHRFLDADWRKYVDAQTQPLTQTVGQAVAAARFEAMIVRSAADRPHGVNLVAFPGNFLSDSEANVLQSI